MRSVEPCCPYMASEEPLLHCLLLFKRCYDIENKENQMHSKTSNISILFYATKMLIRVSYLISLTI